MPIAPFLSLVWSDSAVYLFQYTGSQFLYNSSALGVDCGLISPNAAVSVDGIAYWMGPDNFYMYNGNVVPMPNVQDIRKYVFDAISTSTTFQVAAVYVPKYHDRLDGPAGQLDSRASILLAHVESVPETLDHIALSYHVRSGAHFRI